MNPKRLWLASAALLLLTQCQPTKTETTTEDSNAENTSATYETVGTIISEGEGLDGLIAEGAQVEKLCSGFAWSEGPVWLPSENKVIFSDVPGNTIYAWSEAAGKEVYLSPSGLTGTDSTGGSPGSNGLLLDAEGRLVLCQHGNRQMARMEAPLNAPAAEFATLTNAYDGKKFSSPNDAAYDAQGNLYFTDPPYGLGGQDDSPLKEQPHNGVYRLNTDGSVDLLVTDLTRPNGIAFSRDYKKLYVANSDPARAIWMVYDVAEDGSLSEGTVLYDATELTATKPGLPDGLKVDPSGNLWATGPGGVWVFGADGTHLGNIDLPMPSANCAFNADYSTLFITAEAHLLRVNLKG